MYNEFMGAFERCWACGWKPGVSDLRDWMRPELHNAHIFGGPNRRHDRRVIVRLCEGCHRLSHGAAIRPTPNKARLPPLNVRNVLWLKRYRDPAYYDRKYYHTLLRHTVAYAKHPPAWFVNEYGRQCPIWLPNHTYKIPPP